MDPNERFNENSSLVPFMYHKKFYEHAGHEEDLLQEGYAALWKCCLGFDEQKGCKFTTYACAAIYRGMLEYVKSCIKKHCMTVSLESVVSESEEGSELRFIDIISVDDNNPTKYAIQESLNRMPKKDRAMICMIMEGKTQNQIAEILSVSQAMVSRRLKKFKQILMEELK